MHRDLGKALLGAALLLAMARCSSGQSVAPPDASAGASGDASPDGIALEGPEAGAVPRIDELAWYAQLKARRPDLTADVTPLGNCYQALTIKPEYRDRLLTGSETAAQIIQAEYTASEQAIDAQWAQALEEGELTYCGMSFVGGCSLLCKTACSACPEGGVPQGPGDGGALPLYYPSGYGLCDYVGYKEGPNTSILDNRGYDWKMLFQLSDYVNGLTSRAYQGFSQALGAAGYHGDSKTAMYPDWARFQYNTLIVHGHTRADAAIAEQLVLSTFGAVLAGYSRGTDVDTAQTGNHAVDWHDYLCQVGGDVSQLPADILAFIRFQD